MPYSFRRLYEITGPWRIACLILAVALASVYLGPSVEPFSGYVDTCAFYLFLFCGIILIPLSAIAFFLYVFTGSVPALPCPWFFAGRNKDDIPKVTRTVSVSEDRLATMESCYSRGIAFWQTVVFPVLISMVILGWAGRYYDYMNWRDPNDYGFYLYPILFAALGIPWHLLFTRRGKLCPYCLTPRTTDSFDPDRLVCLRCHTRFIEQIENEPHSSAPADSQSANPLP